MQSINAKVEQGSTDDCAAAKLLSLTELMLVWTLESSEAQTHNVN